MSAANDGFDAEDNFEPDMEGQTHAAATPEDMNIMPSEKSGGFTFKFIIALVAIVVGGVLVARQLGIPVSSFVAFMHHPQMSQLMPKKITPPAENIPKSLLHPPLAKATPSAPPTMVPSIPPAPVKTVSAEDALGAPPTTGLLPSPVLAPSPNAMVQPSENIPPPPALAPPPVLSPASEPPAAAPHAVLPVVDSLAAPPADNSSAAPPAVVPSAAPPAIPPSGAGHVQVQDNAAQDNNVRIGQLEQKMAVLEQGVTDLKAAQVTHADISDLKASLDALQKTVDVLRQAQGTKTHTNIKKKAVTQHITAHRTTRRHVSVAQRHKTSSGGAWVSHAATQWVLKSAKPGQAWLMNKETGELTTVAIGNTLKGLGRVTAIAQDTAGQWVVAGTAGRVTSAATR